MPQPSAQGIASLYMGNPGALQQRVQKDQQAKPGLPPDLKQLMALNIVTNEQDAAKRQQAMSALNSMAPAGQEPPTVAQSIQAQAKQKLQAQMLQQQRQQQGLQALAQQAPAAGVPEGTPQPDTQPQGIDELPVEMGLAGGGIVAFAGGEDVRGYETPYDRMNRENREKAERDQAEREARAREMGNETTSYGEQMRNVGRFFGQFVPDPVRLVRRLVSDPTLESETPTARPAQASYSNEGRREVVPAAPVRDLKAAASEAKTAPTAKAAAAAPTAPAAAQAPAQSLADLVAQRKKLADAERDAEMERYGKLMPRPDTSQYDRLIAELESRKKQFDAPAKGYDAFMELMGQIAAQGPQRTWYEAGAKGAAAQTALDKERRGQQFELTKQAIDVAQKKIDTDRAYNKELYATGTDAAKRIDQITKDTATEMGLDTRNAANIAKDLKVANIHAAATRYSADARQEGRMELTPAQRAAIVTKATKAVDDLIKDVRSVEFRDVRAGRVTRDALISAEVNRLMAESGLGTMPKAPGAPQGPGGTRPSLDSFQR